MKWTKERVAELRRLCQSEYSNKRIAEILKCDVKDIYAKRSQLGITIDKCKKTNKDKLVKAAAKKYQETDEPKPEYQPLPWCPMQNKACVERRCAWWLEFENPDASCCVLVGIFENFV